MKLIPLWQLVTMSMGRLHAKFEGLEPCASPFVNGFCYSIVSTSEKQKKMVKISIFFKKVHMNWTDQQFGPFQ